MPRYKSVAVPPLNVLDGYVRNLASTVDESKRTIYECIVSIYAVRCRDGTNCEGSEL